MDSVSERFPTVDLPVKITSPDTPDAVPRERLFRLLDRVRRHRLVWVSSLAGSGKTTLLATYVRRLKLPYLWYRAGPRDVDVTTFFSLIDVAARKKKQRRKISLPTWTAEYSSKLPLFTRTYFELLFLHLSSPSVVVLDDYQEIPQNSPFHKMINQGLELVPKGSTVFILTRRDLPPQLARWKADLRTCRVGWNDIRLTIQETKKIIRAQKPAAKCSAQTALAIHRKTEGWAAGVTLMLRDNPGDMESPRKASIPLPVTVSDNTPAVFFDYFPNVVFKTLSMDVQNFLMKTSFLSSMTIEMAQRINETQDARGVLQYLCRNHYFTFEHPRKSDLFHYHPLFREFLQRRGLESYGRTALRKILKHAGPHLKHSGSDEDAVRLYRTLNDWNSLSRLILEKASGLIEKGRGETVDSWISCIPRSKLKASPRLLYWRAICRMNSDFHGCYTMMVQAFHLLKKRKDLSGALLACGTLLKLHLQTFENDFPALDPFLKWLEQTGRKKISSPEFETLKKISPVVLLVLTYRKPNARSIPFWKRVAMKRSAEISAPPEVLTVFSYLLSHHLLMGDYDRLNLLVKELKPYQRGTGLPLPDKILSLLLEALSILYTEVDWRRSLNLIQEALPVSHSAGIRPYDYMLRYTGAVASLLAGDISSVERFLSEIKDHEEHLSNHKRSGFHLLLARKASLLHNFSGAVQHLEIATARSKKAGVPIHTVICLAAKAFAHAQLSRFHKAKSCLKAARTIGTMGLPLSRYMVLTAETFVMFKQGREHQAVKKLREAFQLGARHSIRMVPCWSSPAMSFLCAKALEYGIEKDYVVNLIRKHHLIPEPQFESMKEWPRAVRIFTLGRFEIYVDGQKLVFAKKVQKKPLKMLRAIICLGGKNTSEWRVNDLLWPDAEGDSAHKAFEVTLIRLRKILGKNSIQYQDHTVTLNRQHCWVDVFAQESIATKALNVWNQIGKNAASREDALRLTSRALELAGGTFLPEEHFPWANEIRERVRAVTSRLSALNTNDSAD